MIHDCSSYALKFECDCANLLDVIKNKLSENDQIEAKGREKNLSIEES